MYGWRSRIGLLTPAINTVVEHDFARMAPEGVSVHTSRVDTASEGSVSALEGMAEAAVEAGRLLGAAKPDVAVFACTSSSFVHGAGWTARIEARIGASTGCPVISTSTASSRALERIGARRVAVVSPYVADTNDRLRAYLEAQDLEVTELRTFDLLDMYAHATIPPEEIYRTALSLELRGVDAVFISCTQLRTIDIIPELERDLGLPVVTAVQASFWAALDHVRVGLPASGYGSLLEGAR